MALDNNKNQPGDYQLFIRQLDDQVTNIMYKHGPRGDPTQILHPGDGLLPSAIHSQMLAKNAVDIESTLRGIRANDLVNGPFKAEPQLETIPSLNIIQKREPFMPEPLSVSRKNRPMFLN